MTAGRSGRPRALVGLIAAVAFQGVSGVVGGIGLVADPSGESIGLPSSWLEGSPFADYLVPGLVLITVLGIAPMLSAYGLWARWRRSWYAALGVGLALLIWLTVEIAVIGYQPTPPLQLVYGIVGFLIVGLALLPTVRNAFRAEASA